MLVTVIRSKVGEVVELPDGWLLKPYKFVEVVELPDAFKPGKDGKGGLQKMVDAGLVDVSQIQDIGHLMTYGTAENRLPQGVTGSVVPGAPVADPKAVNKVEKDNKEKPDYYTENSRVGLMSPKEKSASADFRGDPKDQYASKVSVNQLARGAGADLDPAELKSAADQVKVASSVQASSTAAPGAPLKPGEAVQVPAETTVKANAPTTVTAAAPAKA